MKTVMFNPYTGTPRHPSDIASDPSGLLILEPGAPLRAAAQVVALEPEGPDGHGVNWQAVSDIQLTAQDTAIISKTNPSEIKRVTVVAVYSAPDDQVTGQYDFEVVNVPFA